MACQSAMRLTSSRKRTPRNISPSAPIAHNTSWSMAFLILGSVLRVTEDSKTRMHCTLNFYSEQTVGFKAGACARASADKAESKQLHARAAAARCASRSHFCVPAISYRGRGKPSPQYCVSDISGLMAQEHWSTKQAAAAIGADLLFLSHLLLVCKGPAFAISQPPSGCV